MNILYNNYHLHFIYVLIYLYHNGNILHTVVANFKKAPLMGLRGTTACCGEIGLKLRSKWVLY